MRSLFAFALILVFCPTGVALLPQEDQESNRIIFENQSGQLAMVKLVGPSSQSLSVRNGQNRTVVVQPGEYYFLVRYGAAAGQFSYRKSARFSVDAEPGKVTQVSVTLHTVAGGNFSTKPSSAREFNSVAAEQAESTGPSAPEEPKGSIEQAGDRSYWEAINKSDPDELRLYLTKYPDGEYAELARVRLKKLMAVNESQDEAPQEQRAKPATTPSPEVAVDLTGKSLCMRGGFHELNQRFDFESNGVLTHWHVGDQDTQGTWRQTGKLVHVEYTMVEPGACLNVGCTKVKPGRPRLMKESGEVTVSRDGGLELSLQGRVFSDGSGADQEYFYSTKDCH
jgi:hypothetical protein